MMEAKSYTPRIYQNIARDFLFETRRASLYAEVGLGKTVTVLSVFEDLMLAGYETKPMLVISTLRIAESVWKEEPLKWVQFRHIEVSTVVGDKYERAAALKKPASIYTINSENVPWLLEHLEGRWPFGMIVFDESTRLRGLRVSIQTHAKSGKKFLNGQGTKMTKKLAKVAYNTQKERWINLSGTPSLNRHLTALWPQTWFLDFGKRLGTSYDGFTSRWFKTSYDGYSLEPLPHAEKEIMEAVKDICLSIRTSDYFNVKDPVVTRLYVHLPPSARKIYDDMEKKFFATVGNRSVEAVNAAVKSVKLLQIASGAAYVDQEADADAHPKAKEWKLIHNAKIDALADLIEEMSGTPLIVAYKFRSDLERLQKAFPKGRVLKTKKDENDFKAGKIEVLFAHPASAAHGIDGFQNVTNHIAFFSHDHDLELREQIIGRICGARQLSAGFDRPVMIYDIIAKDTFDEEVNERYITKASIQDTFMNAIKRRGRTLS